MYYKILQAESVSTLHSRLDLSSVGQWLNTSWSWLWLGQLASLSSPQGSFILWEPHLGLFSGYGEGLQRRHAKPLSLVWGLAQESLPHFTQKVPTFRAWEGHMASSVPKTFKKTCCIPSQSYKWGRYLRIPYSEEPHTSCSSSDSIENLKGAWKINSSFKNKKQCWNN